MHLKVENDCCHFPALFRFARSMLRYFTCFDLYCSILLSHGSSQTMFSALSKTSQPLSHDSALISQTKQFDLFYLIHLREWSFRTGQLFTASQRNYLSSSSLNHNLNVRFIKYPEKYNNVM